MSSRLKREYRLLLAFALVCGAILYFGSVDDARFAAEKANAKARIRSAAALASGSIVDFRNLTGKHSKFVGYYTFRVMGKLYNGEKEDWRLRGRQFEILGKLFPVIYERDRPDNSAILIFRSDFSEFGLPYPDSLRSMDNADEQIANQLN